MAVCGFRIPGLAVLEEPGVGDEIISFIKVFCPFVSMVLKVICCGSSAMERISVLLQPASIAMADAASKIILFINWYF